MAGSPLCSDPQASMLVDLKGISSTSLCFSLFLFENKGPSLPGPFAKNRKSDEFLFLLCEHALGRQPSASQKKLSWHLGLRTSSFEKDDTHTSLD